MIPLGDYRRLLEDVKERYDGTETVTFGILIADYKLDYTCLTIIDYLNYFNNHSHKYINFYIPGYSIRGNGTKTEFEDEYGNAYFFSKKLFIDFLLEVENSFGYKYDYEPVLILVEYNGLDFMNCKKMVIHLDNFKKAGKIFDVIFDIAKEHVELRHFEKGIKSTFLKGAFINTIIKMIGNKYLTELKSFSDNIREFKIQ